MLEFEELRLKNFLSFGEEEQVIRFDNLSGVRWIYGENHDVPASTIDEKYEEDEEKAGNGAGKSSFPIAIGWILFGEVLKRKTIKLNRIANRKAGKHVKGWLTFKANNIRYRIERYRQYKSLGNSLLLYEEIKDGEWKDLSRSESGETQDLINNIILINHPTFMKSILFARDDMTDFLEMGVTKRSEIFENIIQLNKFQSLWNNNYNKLLAVKRELQKINEEILSLEKTKEKTKIFFDKEIIGLREKKDENAAAVMEMEHLLAKFGKIDPNIIAKELDDYAILKKEISDLEEKIRKEAETVKDMEKRVVESENKIKKTEKKVEELKTELSELKPVTCENCGHPQHKQEFDAKCVALQMNIDDWSADIPDYKDIYNRDAVFLKESQISLENLSNEYKVKYSRFQKVSIDESLRKKLEKSKTDEARKKIIDEIIKASEVLNNLNKFRLDGSNLKMYRAEIRKDSKELKELYAKRKEKNDRKERMEILHSILDVKEENSIKNHLVSQIIPVYNTILQKNMFAMYEGEVELSFDSTMKETLVVSGHTMYPEELSTGERGKLNFVINLSIFDLTRINLNGSNIIFFDEIFTSLDKPTIKKMINLILSKFGADTLIHIISHDDYVKSNVKPVEVLKIVKKDDESRIVVED